MVEVDPMPMEISIADADFIRITSGILGNFTSIVCAFFLIPPPLVFRFWLSRSMGLHSLVPHLTALLSCMFWVLYGLPIVQPNNIFVITSNAAGCLIAMFYLLLNAIYSKSWIDIRWKVITILILKMIIVGVSAAIVLSVVRETKLRSHIVGIIASICQFGTYAGQLSEAGVIRKKNKDGIINGVLPIASLMNCTFWIIYALFPVDPYLLVPNAVGFVLTLLLVVIFALDYMSNPRYL